MRLVCFRFHVSERRCVSIQRRMPLQTSCMSTGFGEILFLCREDLREQYHARISMQIWKQARKILLHRRLRRRTWKSPTSRQSANPPIWLGQHQESITTIACSTLEDVLTIRQHSLFVKGKDLCDLLTTAVRRRPPIPCLVCRCHLLSLQTQHVIDLLLDDIPSS